VNAHYFLCGVLVAWTIAQVGLGAFFMLAYALGRREVEYLLFGLLCFALAVTTAGISYTYGAPEHWLIAAHITHAGAIAAVALNLHFVMRYAGVKKTACIASGVYGLGLFYEVLVWGGLWWDRATLHSVRSHVFGVPVEHLSATPHLLAESFYYVAVAELVASLVLLGYAYRSGKREALISLAGGVIVALAVANDILLLVGKLHSVYLLPHGFLVYAFAVASTLLLRYRTAAGELEQTASNLRQRTEELRHSHAELKEIQNELVTKQQLAAVGELAAAIAHEVRNPLAVIVNAVAGLRRSGLRDEDREMLLGIVDEEAARLNRLVTDLLRYARPVSVKRALVSLPEMVRRAESAAMQEHDVVIAIDGDPEAYNVWADAGLLRLVFDNLVENAIQAMPGGGRLTVRVARDESAHPPTVCIEITDSGHGMESQVLERAVDPFFTTRPSGTGLGLPIVERILEAHDGRVEISSEPSKGTTVRLFIPVGESPERGPEVVAARPRLARPR
jgi:signal transduction histidine kinase